MIWEYRNSADGVIATKSIEETHNNQFHCPFCKTDMTMLGTITRGSELSQKTTVNICSMCGWWNIEHIHESYANLNSDFPILFTHHRFSFGTLKNLTIVESSAPIDELKRYLLARYSDRFLLNPRKFEEIVAGVYSDFGYEVVLTSYSGDNGIDIAVLQGDGEQTIGIQVKRYRNKIEAEQIRSLAGALILNKLTAGVFVTTSDFTKGSEKAADYYVTLGLPIKLINATNFFEILRLSTRPIYHDINDDTAPFYTFIQNPDLIQWRYYERAFI